MKRSSDIVACQCSPSRGVALTGLQSAGGGQGARRGKGGNMVPNVIPNTAVSGCSSSGQSTGLRSREPVAATLRVVPGGCMRRAAASGPDFIDRLAAMAEGWRPIAGWPGYEVSDRGRVRTLKRRSRPKMLRQFRNHRGYMRVMLIEPGRRLHARVHVLVASAFIGPAPGPGYTVDHQDRNKRNNAPGNLEWVTRLENYRRHLQRARQALEDVLDMFAPPVRRAAGGSW